MHSFNKNLKHLGWILPVLMSKVNLTELTYKLKCLAILIIEIITQNLVFVGNLNRQNRSTVQHGMPNCDTLNRKKLFSKVNYFDDNTLN
jgi:hypothetical protein